MSLFNIEKKNYKYHDCTTDGICGKNPIIHSLQSLVLQLTKNLSAYMTRLRNLGYLNNGIDDFVIKSLHISTSDNNFDAKIYANIIHTLENYKNQAKNMYEKVCHNNKIKPDRLTLPGSQLKAEKSINALISQGEKIAISRLNVPPDIIALYDLMFQGLKGITTAAELLDDSNPFRDEAISFLYEHIDMMNENYNLINEADGHPELLEKVRERIVISLLKSGEMNDNGIEAVHLQNSQLYGSREFVKVNKSPVAGKAILVSGSDLKVLQKLLDETKGKNINVYTHGEMVIAHSFPFFRQYPHLAGNYQTYSNENHENNQYNEFSSFPGSVLLTTSFSQEIPEVVKGRIFSTALAAWPAVVQVDKNHLSKVIDATNSTPGFSEDSIPQEKSHFFLGLDSSSLQILIYKIADFVKDGRVKNILMFCGFCSKTQEHEYYKDIVRNLPDDTIILRVGSQNMDYSAPLRHIDDLPVIINIGEHYDAFSTVKSVHQILRIFEECLPTPPISLFLAAPEQKPVSTILGFFDEDIQNIFLGPTFANVTNPTLYDALENNFSVNFTSSAQEDLNKIRNAEKH